MVTSAFVVGFIFAGLLGIAIEAKAQRTGRWS